MIKAISLSALSLALLGFNNAAHADITEMDSPRIYTGIGYGQYSFEFEDSENDTDFDDDSQMLKGYIGTQFNKYLSLELAYQNFDEVSDIDSKAEIDGVSLAARLAAPITDSFSVYAKGGWLEWDAEIEQDLGELGSISADSDGGDVFYGAGVEYAFTTNMQVRLEYERYKLEDDIDPDMDVASVSFQYMF
ncbi:MULTISPECIES: outer membrane beta-barrel protein [Pseudoalteromonas]|jgi:opacity protein-like surface antigen|uniref:outer membrane beta-barrel protein n=1 Tax=Pseudoalteromonas TaxID=53246 RepID=UPI0006DCAF33|nr:MULTISPECIES: outer membrane beta-barrel protein [Pseudoalteromonas]MDC3191221.1 outer membrane beta-barrel protein [Pseudoalteromonas elyakovii]MED5515000.1 outer membrane beta-barrel protein [Pseudomonadota bacterium]KPW01531.1 Outer membrane protein A precursor [Pseudoalteromonas sp. P1-8]KZY56449.1 TonB-dependent receptor [Pseudoalteromonas shioyasakiensis]MCF2846924.1 outer membrane beta-barrel protein [Pseudoalteromonas sp. PAST1]|tara:strand:+ start:323 stop:895 length:573 start_codon:yes stop_codon:yes gene_type:complete